MDDDEATNNYILKNPSCISEDDTSRRYSIRPFIVNPLFQNQISSLLFSFSWAAFVFEVKLVHYQNVERLLFDGKTRCGATIDVPCQVSMEFCLMKKPTPTSNWSKYKKSDERQPSLIYIHITVTITNK